MWFRKSIVAKLLIPTVLILVVGFAAIATVNNANTKKLVWSGTENADTETASRMSAEIESYIKHYSGIVLAMANSSDVIDFAAITEARPASAYQDKPEYTQYLATIQAIASQDENIYNLYFGSEKSQTFFDMHESVLADDFMCDKKSWYVEGKQANELYVTTPYIDGVTGKPIVSIEAPVYRGDTYLGLFVMDISLETVNGIVSSMDTFEGGYAFLLDREGTFLVHPDEKLVMQAKATEIEGDFGQLADKMLAGKPGHGKSSLKGETYYTFYSPVDLAGWSIGVNVPEKVLAAPINKQRNFNITICLAILVASALIIFYTVRRALKPLNYLTQVANEVAAGDLSMDVKVKSEDEIGRLAGHLNEMVISLREFVGAATEQAEKVTSHSQQLASASEEVTATVEEVASTTNEVAATSATGAENAQEVAKQSEHVHQAAEEGSQAVEKTVAKINAIAETTANVSQAIEKLGTQSEQIGQIINAITNIAEQTNLLALNAAIEAARAGEHGRGFAVVAEEVRKLAEESGHAANEITLLIKEIQQGVEQAINAVEYGSKEVSEGVQIANNTGTALEQILTAVEKTTNMIGDVATGAEQANEGTQQLSASGEQISSAVQQIAGAAQDLASVADELYQTVEKFKLEKEAVE